MFGNRPHFVEESELLDYQEEQELTLGHSTDLYGTISERDVYARAMDKYGYTFPVILGSRSGKYTGQLDDLAFLDWSGNKKRVGISSRTGGGKSVLAMWIAQQLKYIYRLPFVGVDRFGEYYSQKQPLEGSHVWKLKRLGLTPRGFGNSCTYLKPAFLFTPGFDKSDYLFGVDVDTIKQNINNEMEIRMITEQLLGIEEGTSSQDERYMASRELLVEKFTKEHCNSFKEVQASLQSDMDRILDAQSGRKGGYYEKLSFSPALKRKVDSSLYSGTIGHGATLPETEDYSCLESHQVISPRFADYLKEGKSLMLQTTITGAAKMRAVEAIEALMISSLINAMNNKSIGKVCYLNEEARVAVPAGTEVSLLKTAYVNWAELGRKVGGFLIDVSQSLSKLDSAIVRETDCFLTTRITNRKDLRKMEEKGIDPAITNEVVSQLPYSFKWPVKPWVMCDDDGWLTFYPYPSMGAFHQEQSALTQQLKEEFSNNYGTGDE